MPSTSSPCHINTFTYTDNQIYNFEDFFLPQGPKYRAKPSSHGEVAEKGIRKACDGHGNTFGFVKHLQKPHIIPFFRHLWPNET